MIPPRGARDVRVPAQTVADLVELAGQRDAWRELALALDEVRLCELRKRWPKRLQKALARLSKAHEALLGLRINPSLATVSTVAAVRTRAQSLPCAP